MTDKTATQQAQAEVAGAVIGINLGHSYGSIACINQHGRADVIANEDGERQLATRISFNGGQVYIGNQATPQLVRNAHNTVDYFVNMLGRSYSDLSEAEKSRTSSPVIDVDGTPSFKVEIDGKETILSVHQVTVKFLRSLFLTAKDFLSGVPISGCVLSIPLFFKSNQISALKTASKEAGLIVFQLIPSPSAALVAYGLTSPTENKSLPNHPDEEGISNGTTLPYPKGKELDRIILVLDLGGTSTSSTLLSSNSGIYSLLNSSENLNLGGRDVDDALVQYLSKEFNKKTKISIGKDDKRAWQKLRNEAEVTKRALSASGSAQCSVESLAEGCDFSASVNRVRLDMLAGPTYNKVLDVVRDSLKKAGLEPVQVDEVVLAGASSRLPGLIDQLTYVFPSNSHTVITSSIDPDQVLARGSAVHAQVLALLSTYSDSEAPEKVHALSLETSPPQEISSLKVPTLKKPFGLIIPAPNSKDLPEGSQDQSIDGKLFVTLLAQNTPLPVRRTFTLKAPAEKDGEVLLEFAEGTSDIKVELIQPEVDEEDEEDDEPLEPEEVRIPRIKADQERKAQISIRSKKNGKVAVQVITLENGKTTIEVSNEDGDKEQVELPASA